MKKSILFLFLVLGSMCKAQDIIGIWQVESPLMAEYQSYYDFNENNVFSYVTDGYNGLTRIGAINGSYEIKGDSIYFTVLYINEIVGGTITRRPSTANKRSEMELYWIPPDSSSHRPIPTTSNYWGITNYKTQKTIFEKPETLSASFRYYKDETGQEIIEIDGEKFYYIPGPEEFGDQLE